MEITANCAEIDVCTATIESLVTACSNPSREELGASPVVVGRTIVKIFEQAVIKFGLGVTESEVNTQRGACLLLNPNVVRVPWVYRFFENEGLSYIAMEYVKGRVITSVEDPDLIFRIARILDHFAEFMSRTSGPLRFGVPRGLLWPEEEVFHFKNIQDVERYFNSRLPKNGPRA